MKNFRIFLHRSGELISVKGRNYKTHQLETRRITDRILEIKKNHPELSKYLNMIPEFKSHANDSETRLADLRKYQVKLLDLLEKYEIESDQRFWFI